MHTKSTLLKDTMQLPLADDEPLSSGCHPPDFLLQVFLNSTSDSYIFLDETLTVVCSNEAVLKTAPCFFTQRPVPGSPVLDFVAGPHIEKFKTICRNVLAGETFTEVLHLTGTAGKNSWVEKTFRPARNADSQIIGIIITARDFTETREKEQELKISNERYELISRATSDAIWDFDILNQQIYFNEAFTRYFGHHIKDSSEAYTLWINHIHPGDKERVMQKLQHSIEGEDLFWDDEYRFTQADGRTTWVYDRGMVLRDATGAAVRMIGSMQDISRQKEAELKTALSEHRFRKLVQSGTDLIGILDAAGNYTYVSPTVEMLGYQPAELLGRNAFDFMHPEDVPAAMPVFEALLQQKQVQVPMFRFRAKNGDWRWIETSASNLLDDPAIGGIVVNSRDVTEKKRRDQALEKAVSDLNKILDSSLDVIVVTDAENRYVQVSAAAKAVWGYEPEELIGRICLDLVHPADIKHTNVVTEAVMNGARITNFQNRYIRKDGTVVPLIWSARWDDQDKVMYAIARDASEKREAEEALQRSEKNYRYLFQNNPLPMFAFDIDTFEFMMVNNAAYEFYGYSAEEFSRISVLDIRPQEEREKLRTFISSVKGQPGVNQLIGWKHLKKDGTIVDVDSFGHNIMIEGRHCRLAVVYDVTERNVARTRLQKSEAMFRAISESFPNGIVIILDRQMRFVYTAGTEFGQIGLSPGSYLGKHYTDLFPDEQGLLAANAEKIFCGESMVSELRFYDRNYLLSSVPLYEPDGSIQRILVVAQNITTQKRVQKEKELLINELTKNIHDLRQFSYITSHNLRAPISNLIGIMSLIDMNSIPDPDTAFLVEKFKESTYILNETVNDLLSILLIKNNVNVSREAFGLTQVWQDVCTSVASQVAKAGAEIEADFTEGNDIVFNKTYAESILLNLLTNSLKYRHPDRKLKIRLRTSIEDDYVVLQFSDNGIGINLDHHREKIFGLYQRFHNNPDSKGLGLYIVHSQITALGGKIEVESEPDRGTCFKVCFKR